MRSLFLLLAGCLFFNQVVMADSRQFSFESGGVQRTGHELVPSSIRSDVPAPLLILLHGSGSRGERILKSWASVAEQSGIIVVAPDSLNDWRWQIKADGPRVFNDLINVIAARQSVDLRRLFLFGHSGGAVYALTLSLLESELFAATAVHAGAWREKRDFNAASYARRKIPIAMFVGDRDPFFSIRDVRQTESALTKAGHAVMVTILRRHDHDYADVADNVNEAAWSFLSQYRLEANPVFQSYDE